MPTPADTPPTGLLLRPLAPYEARLLAALAYFRTGRDRPTQAHHCLSMYLRQSEARIMGEVAFYAEQAGVTPRELLETIFCDPDQADRWLADWHWGVAPVARDEPQ
ncbi:MAG: hypothetical protein HC838_05320 [Spirulinaceae cyanobacterium RM2_2_10]|nr:hypothetical protein [Spirulinaceae cyanobacterium SM2_1_0]NJO19587.1 hypothetical protein [Spirulinaceae cyanobacterium RM2_2_10]